MPWHGRFSKQCKRSRNRKSTLLEGGETGGSGAGGWGVGEGLGKKNGQAKLVYREPKSIARSETSPRDLGAHPEVHTEEGGGLNQPVMEGGGHWGEGIRIGTSDRFEANYSSNLRSPKIAARGDCRAPCICAGRMLAACFGRDRLQRLKPIHWKFSVPYREEYICLIALCTTLGGHQRLCRCCAMEVGRSPRRTNLAVAENHPSIQAVINRTRSVGILDFCCVRGRAPVLRNGSCRTHATHETVGEELGCLEAPVTQE